MSNWIENGSMDGMPDAAAPITRSLSNLFWSVSETRHKLGAYLKGQALWVTASPLEPRANRA